MSKLKDIRKKLQSALKELDADGVTVPSFMLHEDMYWNCNAALIEGKEIDASSVQYAGRILGDMLRAKAYVEAKTTFNDEALPSHKKLEDCLNEYMGLLRETFGKIDKNDRDAVITDFTRYAGERLNMELYEISIRMQREKPAPEKPAGMLGFLKKKRSKEPVEASNIRGLNNPELKIYQEKLKELGGDGHHALLGHGNPRNEILEMLVAYDPKTASREGHSHQNTAIRPANSGQIHK